MARTQKTFYLENDLAKLLDAIAGRTGATFTRLITAAVMQYLFTDPRGPDPRWMEAVVRVERGTMSLGEVPVWVAQKPGLEAAEQMREMREEALECGETEQSVMSTPAFKALRAELQAATGRTSEWDVVSKLADNPLDGLLLFWQKLAAGISDYEIINAIDGHDPASDDSATP